MKMLFIGPQYLGSSSRSLREAFQDLDIEVDVIDPNEFYPFGSDLSNRIFRKMSKDEFHVRNATNVLNYINANLNLTGYTLLFVFKGVSLSGILEGFNGLKVHFHPDDSSNEYNRGKLYDQTEGLYDIHFTPKRHNLTEIYDRTRNNNVHFIWYGYDPRIHKNVSTEYGSGLGFIGNRRRDRVALIHKLAELYGKDFYLAGEKWRREVSLVFHSNVFNFVAGAQYQKIVAIAPIQIGLLNSDNRDTHSARTFEIPASGGLFLGEKTFEHEMIFEDSKSAVLFENGEDLVHKIDYLRQDRLTLMKIRQNGERIIRTGKNTWRDRAMEILKVVKLS